MRRIAAVSIVLVLILAGCSGTSREPGGRETTTAPTTTEPPEPEVSLPADVRPFPDDVASQEGTRYAATEFDPVFTFVGVAGMPYPFWGDLNSAGFVLLTAEADAIMFLRPDAVFEADGSEAPVPDDLAAWLAGRPGLDAEPPAEARLAGLEGTLIRATLTGSDDPKPEACEAPCVNLLRSGGEQIWLESGRLIEFHVFDLASGPLLVLVDTTEGNQDYFLAKAGELLDSVEFLET